MTKSNITQYDNTAANNTDVEDVPLGENQMYPADVNNAFREVMADLADVNDGTVALTSPKATAFEVTNNIVVGGTVDGRDVATDGTKLDGIEDSADVTDTANVTAAGALMDSEVTNLAQVKAFDSSDYATAAQGTTADAALPKAGGAMTGAITTNSTFDGRDVATDGTKLDGIEALADVTDATNVAAAGAAMLTGATFTGDLSLGDNHAILLGDEPNLSISHNATNSVIADVGGGNITMSTNGNQILFYDSLNSRSMFRTATNGRLELFYQGDIKLETKSEGIEVTGSVVSQVGINAQTGTTYTTVLADQSKLVTLTNASAITLTIPANSSVAYPVGTKIDFAQLGAGQVTVAGAGGVTVNATPTLKFRDQYSAASCIKTATDTWLLVGDLEA